MAGAEAPFGDACVAELKRGDAATCAAGKKGLTYTADGDVLAKRPPAGSAGVVAKFCAGGGGGGAAAAAVKAERNADGSKRTGCIRPERISLLIMRSDAEHSFAGVTKCAGSFGCVRDVHGVRLQL